MAYPAPDEPDASRADMRPLPLDPRVASCLFAPARPARGLVVAVHGSERDAVGMRDAFAAFAEAHELAVLAPLFPVRIGGREDIDNYKFIQYADLRFDELLVEMVSDAQDRLGRPFGRWHLVGFSGGAQFVHRFYYLHPGRIASASIVAPGRITVLDDAADWWAGTRDVRDIFGHDIDLSRLRQVPLQIVVGDQDTDGSRGGRLEQARALRDNLIANAIRARLDVVAGAGHELNPLIATITDFLGEQVPPPEGRQHVPL